MSEYLTDEEQAAAVKKFVKSYGLSIVLGVLIAIGVGFGWRYWQNYKASRAFIASDLYTTMQAQPNNNTKLGKQLMDNYAATPYGALAALTLAKENVTKKDYAAAEKNLQWVIKNASAKSLQQIGRLRLARVLIELKKPQQALSTLNEVNDPAFTAMINDVRGDANVALKKVAIARTDYNKALAAFSTNNPARANTLMKLSNLPTT